MLLNLLRRSAVQRTIWAPRNPLFSRPSGFSIKIPAQGLTGLRLYASAAVQKNSVTVVSKPKEAYNTSKAKPATSLPRLERVPSRTIGIWLMISSTLVLGIIVVGGVTRLTESGLSITEWRPITGVVPPISAEEWDQEFTKYKATPEFKLLNQSIELDDFKRIFHMEWAHRVLGRVLGVAFVAPLVYFAARRQLTRPLALKLGGMAVLIGAQGLLGWYMVQSGLDDALLETPGAVPRVSQYRLASHLGLALVLYAGMFGTGISIIRDWKFVNSSSMKMSVFTPWRNSRHIRRFLVLSQVVTGLVLVTAVSGAFVAGLDAGLVYNDFPYMGGQLIPPVEELYSTAYAKGKSSFELWWRNMLENPTTVQFNHRVLAMTTYASIGALYALSFRKGSGRPLRRAAGFAFAMANVQAALGISTLWYMVPVPLAASHQAGSVFLLTAMIHLLLCFRHPSRAARLLKERLRSKTRK